MSESLREQARADFFHIINECFDKGIDFDLSSFVSAISRCRLLAQAQKLFSLVNYRTVASGYTLPPVSQAR